MHLELGLPKENKNKKEKCKLKNMRGIYRKNQIIWLALAKAKIMQQ